MSEFNGIKCEIFLKSQSKKRIVCLTRLYERNIFHVEAIDSPDHLLRSFFVKDPIPFNKFLLLLASQWSISKALPLHFTLQKRLPVNLIESIPNLNSQQCLSLYQKLTEQGYLMPITPLKRGYQPKSIPWEEVASRCMS